MRFPRISGLALAAMLAGTSACATYRPLPLDTTVIGKPDPGRLQHAGNLPDRLGVDDIERLALTNNPDLMAARAARGLARAQVQLAGILPNPSISGNYQEVLNVAGLYAPVTAALTQDLKSVVTLSAKRHAAQQAAQATDAGIAWEEWQIIGKARLSAIDLIEGDRQLALLRQNAALWKDHVERTRAALAQGDTTLVTLAPDLAAASDAQKAADDFERQQQTRRRDLKALLGLAPTAPLRLVDSVTPAPLDAAAVRAALPGLADHRPDLVALQLGYAAQEQAVRAAILAQFPVLSIGPSYASDPGNVRSLGPQLTLDLPLFDRNQGNIARERATRAQLHAEFEARLLAAQSAVAALLADRELLQRQLVARQAVLAEVEPTAQRAQSAWERRDIDERTYVELVTTANAKHQEVLALELTVLEQQVAIATLAGIGMPPMLPAGHAARAAENDQ